MQEYKNIAMKKITLLFSIFIISYECFGQDTISKTSKWKSNNIIKTNLFGYIKHSTYFSYERVLTENISIIGTYGQGKYSITGPNAEENVRQKIGRSFPCVQELTLKSSISIEPRYYLSFKHNRIPAGFHIGPSFNFIKGSETFTSTGEASIYNGFGSFYVPETVTTEYKITSILINIGPQLLIKRILAVDISVGLGYGKISGNAKNVTGNSQQNVSSYNFSYNALAASFSVSIGIAFGK